MDENLKLLVTIIGAGGGSVFITSVFNGFGKMRSGVAQRERVKNTSLANKAAKYERERDEADVKRREAEEHVSILQRQLILLGEKPFERIELD
jgi:hypothetical protein